MEINRMKPPTRKPLPYRRRSYNQKFRIGGQVIHLTVGEYDDGKPGEIFLVVNKTGSALRAMCDAVAMSVSVGLQHGIPLQQYVQMFKGMKFEPNGAVHGRDDVEELKEAESILDLVFKELEISYPERTKPEPEQENLDANQP